MSRDMISEDRKAYDHWYIYCKNVFDRWCIYAQIHVYMYVQTEMISEDRKAYDPLRYAGVYPYPNSRGPPDLDPTPNSSGGKQAQLYSTVDVCVCV